MYIRTIKRKNKDGSLVEYAQPANNVWNKEKGFAQAQVIHSFGRSDQLDVEGTLKSTLCLRPVYHFKDERIRSYVLLCWLALLLIRIAEVETEQSWPRIRRRMQQG